MNQQFFNWNVIYACIILLIPPFIAGWITTAYCSHKKLLYTVFTGIILILALILFLMYKKNVIEKFSEDDWVGYAFILLITIAGGICKFVLNKLIRLFLNKNPSQTDNSVR